MFDDDWEAAVPLYPTPTTPTEKGREMGKGKAGGNRRGSRPPVSLLVAAVGENIFFDPSGEEIAVADSLVAVTIAQEEGHDVKVLGIRMIDPPSRRAGAVLGGKEEGQEEGEEGVWRGKRGGVGRGVVKRIVGACCESGGVGEEVLEGLEGWVV